MKFRYLLPAIGLIAAFCFTACEKKDPFKDNKSEGYLTMKLEGQQLTLSKHLTGSLHDTAANAMLVVSGMTSDNQLLTINVLFPGKQLKPGTYSLDLNGFNSIGWMKTLGSSESYAADDLTLGATSTMCGHNYRVLAVAARQACGKRFGISGACCATRRHRSLLTRHNKRNGCT